MGVTQFFILDRLFIKNVYEEITCEHKFEQKRKQVVKIFKKNYFRQKE